MEWLINNPFEKYSFIANFLLKQTIYSLILFTIIFITAFFLKKKSPQWHHGLWILILIRLLLPTDLSFPVSARNLVHHIPIINNLTTSMEGITKKFDNNGIGNLESVSNNMLLIQKNNSIFTETYNQRKDKFIIRPDLFAIAWSIGSLMMLIVLMKNRYKFHYILKNSSPIIDDKLTVFLLDWQHRLKIRRAVKIVSSDEFLSPFTIGLFRPIIYIPRSFLNSLDMDTIHSIIAHEMVHIKRFDDLWIKLQNILQIVYFFNPAIWYTNRQISLTREQICDSTVLTGGIIPPRVYGNSILQVLKSNLFGLDCANSLPCFGSHKRIYKQRFQNIIKENVMKKQKTVLIFSVISLIGIFVLPLADYSNAGNNEIKMIVPMNGIISSFFGKRISPFTGEREFHSAIDIAASKGTPIFAAASGLVVKVDFTPAFGHTVKLQHSNGYSTVYAECDTILIKEGQAVKAGDILATCGASGRATGPHLHFEIWKDGKPIDPYPYLSGLPVHPIATEKKLD